MSTTTPTPKALSPKRAKTCDQVRQLERAVGLFLMQDQYQELGAVNVLLELDRMGWAYEFTGDDEVKCRCPVHADKSPSCALSTTKKLFKCHTAGCGATGDFVSFMAFATKGTRAAILEYIRKEYSVESVKTIDPSVVEKFHARIWTAGPLLNELRVRGLNDDDIRKYRLGLDDGNRIAIPIYNESGACVNIRRYRPGAPGADKMRNTRGMGKIRLYPIEQLDFDTIVITGGECKAIVIAHHMNADGIGAICCTGGEDNWEAAFSHKFKDKKVFICYDIDEEGKQGANKIAARVRTFASWVGVMHLDLDIDKHPHGDANDYFGVELKKAEDFRVLMDNTTEWVPKSVDVIEQDEERTALRLGEITQAKFAKKMVTTKAVITALDETPYLIPRDVAVECDRNQANCAHCPVYAYEPGDSYTVLTINRTSPAILELVNAGKKTKRDAIREGLRIPPCKSCVFHERTHFNVQDVRLSPQLEITNRSSDGLVLPALIVSHGLEANNGYELTGRVFPHPRSQQAVFLVGESVPSEDALDTYEPTADELVELSCFQPSAWTVEGIQEKLDSLYEDLSANVTRIFDRQELHTFIDLAYHSPLLIPFDGRVEKGWTEVLVVGDSAQGKSEATRRLMEHYGLGEKVEVKNASVAGLLGGLAQMGNNRWMVQWGIIPRHDRRIVILEELKGASTETIGRLTDMRSSGVAEIDKIEKRRTHARTRLVALSNPRSDQPLASYSYGVEAVRELIGSPEDLRRFDAVLVLSASQVNAARLNTLSTNRPSVEHVHVSDLCKRCVLWSWTRKESQVSFDRDTEALILEETMRLCTKFVDVIPIVDRGSVRYKIARLSASLACRTASFGDTVFDVRVRPCHASFITNILDKMYSDPSFGYAQFSEAYRSTRKLTGERDIRAKVLSTPFPTDFVEQMLHTEELEVRDIADWTGWDRQESNDLMSFLVRKHALIRDKRSYRKNPAFIDLLRALITSGDLAKVERPAHIGEKGLRHEDF